MRKLNLMIFATLLAFSLVFTVGANLTFAADTYVFKYAHTQTDEHPRSQSMVFFKNTLEKATNGKIPPKNPGKSPRY